jgi:hypothetical protein
MPLSDLVLKVRSKNAGPFWVTVDIFCGTPDAFNHVTARLDDPTIARLCGTTPQLLKRFDIADLSVVKLSFPRPVVQGGATDRDMHGAQWAALVAEMPLAD